ncbi:MAG: hypothetical protein K2Q26_05000 [Bdellovibrionales bacterium]|nr:hypothetical protein [Bdellovibrionales bacterium]
MIQRLITVSKFTFFLFVSACLSPAHHGVIQHRVSATHAEVLINRRASYIGKEVLVYGHKCTANGLVTPSPCVNYAKGYGKISEIKAGDISIVEFSPETPFEVGDFVEY